MPVQIYSGVALPSAPINRMNNRPMFPQNQTNANQSNSPHPPSTRPSQPHLSQPPHAHRPPTGQFGSSPDFGEEAPPSYDDAIADDAGPVDGLRRNYSQQHSTPSSVGGINSSTKLKDERLFSNNET